MEKGVFEVWETTRPATAFNIASLPQDIRDALYSDRTEHKWTNSHILIDAIQHDPALSGVDVILAPSASGDAVGIGGQCLAMRHHSDYLRPVATGDYSAWIAGNPSLLWNNSTDNP
jgi:hypothetical protein